MRIFKSIFKLLSKLIFLFLLIISKEKRKLKEFIIIKIIINVERKI